MKTFLSLASFFVTIFCYAIVFSFRFIWKQLSRIPIVDLALYITADLCFFLFDKLFMTIGTFIAMKKGNGEVSRYWKSNAVMLDKKLNVSGQYILNWLMIKGEVESYLKFGNEFATVSEHMGRLPKSNDTEFSIWCEDVMLDSIEKDHCAKAVELNNTALIKRVTELNLLNK